MSPHLLDEGTFFYSLGKYFSNFKFTYFPVSSNLNSAEYIFSFLPLSLKLSIKINPFHPRANTSLGVMNYDSD